MNHGHVSRTHNVRHMTMRQGRQPHPTHSAFGATVARKARRLTLWPHWLAGSQQRPRPIEAHNEDLYLHVF